jgi:PAS domain S-box-containing protein
VRGWGAHEDVTALKRAESTLRQLSQAVEQSPASVVITDLGGRIEYVNQRFCDLTGYTRADSWGEVWMLRVKVEEQEKHSQASSMRCCAGTGKAA